MAQMQHGEHREADECLQFSRRRENFAVIELNDVSIAGDFVVPSSLSSGYKVKSGLDSREMLSQGYDWDGSVFDEPSIQSLKGGYLL